MEYWRHLDSRLEERGLAADVIVPKTSNWLPIPIGGSGSAEIQLAFNQQRKQVSVGLNLTGEIGEFFETQLTNEKSTVEKELGYPIEWDGNDIFIADEGIHIWDEEDWPIQHDWMGDRLEEFTNVFKPKVLKLEQEVLANPELRQKIERRGRLAEYWNACATELAGSVLHLRDNDPNSGRIYCRFEQIDTGISFGVQYFNSEGGWVGVYFGISKKAGRRLRSVFKEMAENHKADLESIIGEELEWWDPYLSIYTESRLDDKEDWSRQHKWIREKGEKLLSEFSRRLNLD